MSPRRRVLACDGKLCCCGWFFFSPQTVVSCRNQPVKKLTMGYITNYSYCTATVSSSVVDIFANTCKCIELKFACMHESTCNNIHHDDDDDDNNKSRVMSVWAFHIFYCMLLNFCWASCFCVYCLQIHKCSSSSSPSSSPSSSSPSSSPPSLPRRQNRTGSLHTANRFHDEAGKLLLHLFLLTRVQHIHGSTCAEREREKQTLNTPCKIITPRDAQHNHTPVFFLFFFAKKRKKIK